MDSVEQAIKSLDWLRERLNRVNATLDSNAVMLAKSLLEKQKWKRFSDERPDGKKSVILWVEYGRGFPAIGHVEEDGSVWWLGDYGERFFLTNEAYVFWMDITEP